MDTPTPTKFNLRRITDFEVIQTFEDSDVEEVLDIFNVKSLINSEFRDRARRILEYLYGYSEIIVDLENNKAFVVRPENSAESIRKYVTEEIYSLKYLHEGLVKYDHKNEAYVVDINNGRTGLI